MNRIARRAADRIAAANPVTKVAVIVAVAGAWVAVNLATGSVQAFVASFTNALRYWL